MSCPNTTGILQRFHPPEGSSGEGNGSKGPVILQSSVFHPQAERVETAHIRLKAFEHFVLEEIFTMETTQSIRLANTNQSATTQFVLDLLGFLGFGVHSSKSWLDPFTLKLSRGRVLGQVVHGGATT